MKIEPELSVIVLEGVIVKLNVPYAGAEGIVNVVFDVTVNCVSENPYPSPPAVRLIILPDVIT